MLNSFSYPNKQWQEERLSVNYSTMIQCSFDISIGYKLTSLIDVVLSLLLFDDDDDSCSAFSVLCSTSSLFKRSDHQQLIQ